MTPSFLIVTSALVLAVSGPFLAFPTLVPLAVRTPAVVGAATLCLALSALLSSTAGRLRVLLWAFAVIILNAWFLTPHEGQAAFLASGRAVDALGYPVSVDLGAEALEHLAGIALGLLTMAIVEAWTKTRDRLVCVAAAVALAGTGVLVIGMVGTSPENFSAIHSKFFAPAFADSIPSRQLQIPGLGRDGWVNPNALGATALMVVPFSIAMACMPRVVARAFALRVFGILSTVVAMFVLAFTQSRSVWLAGLVVGLLAVIRYRRPAVAWLAAFVGIVALLMIYVGLSPGASVGRALASLAESAADRLFIWRVAIGLWVDSPWLGIGLNQFHVAESHQPWPLVVAHAHSELIQTLLDIGLLGGFVYAAMQVVLLARAFRASGAGSPVVRTLATAGGLSLVGVHLFGLGDVVALGAKVGVLQWLASGIILSAWALRDTAPDNHTR